MDYLRSQTLEKNVYVLSSLFTTFTNTFDLLGYCKTEVLLQRKTTFGRDCGMDITSLTLLAYIHKIVSFHYLDHKGITLLSN